MKKELDGYDHWDKMYNMENIFTILNVGCSGIPDISGHGTCGLDSH